LRRRVDVATVAAVRRRRSPRTTPWLAVSMVAGLFSVGPAAASRRRSAGD
jgi:hypothetical protein